MPCRQTNSKPRPMTGKNSHQPKPRKQPARALKHTPKPAKAKPSLPNPTIPVQSDITEATRPTDTEQITDLTESPPFRSDEMPFERLDASPFSNEGLHNCRPTTARSVSHPQIPDPDTYNPGLTRPHFSGPFVSEFSSETISFCNECVQVIEDSEEIIEDLQLELAEMNLRMAEQEHEANGRLQVVERQLLSMNQLAMRLAEENDLLHALVDGRTLLRVDPACPAHGHLHQ